MNQKTTYKPKTLLSKNYPARLMIYGVIILFLTNLNALVDKIVHPEIPYFDKEHLIVGGVTFFVITSLFSVLTMFEIRLDHALERTLESVLPICSNCKKIRHPDLPADDPGSWQPLEIYFEKNVSTQFSHGLCPVCLPQIYPHLSKKGDSPVSKVETPTSS